MLAWTELKTDLCTFKVFQNQAVPIDGKVKRRKKIESLSQLLLL